jgi:hypothetical protein
MQCPEKATLDAPNFPEEPPRTPGSGHSEEYQAVQNEAFRALDAAPLPKDWLRLEGGQQYIDTLSDNAPEFCGLRCARLWITLQERTFHG